MVYNHLGNHSAMYIQFSVKNHTPDVFSLNENPHVCITFIGKYIRLIGMEVATRRWSGTALTVKLQISV